VIYLTNVIQIQKLTKTYGSFTVFSDLDFSIKTNSSTAIIGPNGCGKTTLLKSILGLTKTNYGTISLFDRPIIINGSINSKLLVQSRKKIGFVPDNVVFFEHLTAFEYLKLIRVMTHENNDKNDNQIINTVLKEFRLDRWSNRLIHTFSTGTRQKLAVAASLIHAPELLILDEPFRGIDPEIHFKLLHFLKEFKTSGLPNLGIEKHGSIFICSHVLGDIEQLCDALILMNEYGEIVLSGDTKTVKEQLLGDKSFEELLYQLLREENEEEENDQLGDE